MNGYGSYVAVELMHVSLFTTNWLFESTEKSGRHCVEL